VTRRCFWIRPEHPVRVEAGDRIVVKAGRLPSARFGPRHDFSR
jgi:hypothetical protein